MFDYEESIKKVMKTPQKMMTKNRSKTALYSQSKFKPVKQEQTTQKYLYLQLSQSAQKQNSMCKVMKEKDDRIRQLQFQIKQNQTLVKDTIGKWKKQKNDENCEMNQLHQKLIKMNSRMNSLEKINSQLKHRLTEKQHQCSQLKETASQQEKKYHQLQIKYEKMKKRYAVERQEWKATVPLIIQLLEFVKKVPPELIQSDQQ